jgi:streptogramin lyase
VIDLHELLDAETARIEPAADAFDRVLARACRRRRRRRTRVVAVLAAVALLVAVGVDALRQPAGETKVVTAPPSVVHATEIPVGGATDVAIDDAGDAWVPGANAVHRLDGRTGQIIATVDVPGSSDYRYVATGVGAVWVVDSGTASVVRIDPATNTVVATIAIGAVPLSIITGFDSVWVLVDLGGSVPLTEGGTLLRIDPHTNSITRRTDTRGSRLAIGPTDVIVSGDPEGDVFGIDPFTDTVRSAQPFAGQAATVWGAGEGLWITTADSLQRFDPAALRPTGAPIAMLGGAVAVTDRAIWVLQPVSGDAPSQLQRVDPNGPRPVGAPIPVGLTAVTVVASADRVWVANFSAGSVTMLTVT